MNIISTSTSNDMAFGKKVKTIRNKNFSNIAVKFASFESSFLKKAK